MVTRSPATARPSSMKERSPSSTTRSTHTTGTARLKATFPNAHNSLWPGEFVNARVLVRTEKGALTIPSTGASARGRRARSPMS